VILWHLTENRRKTLRVNPQWGKFSLQERTILIAHPASNGKAKQSPKFFKLNALNEAILSFNY